MIDKKTNFKPIVPAIQTSSERSSANENKGSLGSSSVIPLSNLTASHHKNLISSQLVSEVFSNAVKLNTLRRRRTSTVREPGSPPKQDRIQSYPPAPSNTNPSGTVITVGETTFALSIRAIERIKKTRAS